MLDVNMFVCRNPTGSLWQLGLLPPSEGKLALVGWNGRSPFLDDDERHPAAVALLRAITQLARLTFACSELGMPTRGGWTALDSDHLAVVKRGSSPLVNLVRSLASRPSDIVLLSTREAESAWRMFDDAGYPWSLQGQFGLLSDSHGPPPAVESDFELLASLFEPAWAGALPQLMHAEVKAVLRPGVDGDLMGILSSTKEYEDAILASLFRVTASSNLRCAIVSESEFLDLLAPG